MSSLGINLGEGTLFFAQIIFIDSPFLVLNLSLVDGYLQR